MARVGVGILFCEVTGNVLEVLLHLRDGDSGLHATDGPEKMGTALSGDRLGIAGIVVYGERGPNAVLRRGYWEPKRGRHHPDDGVGLAAEINGAAKNGLVRSELVNPECVADQ